MTETQRDIAEYQSDHDLLIVLNERVSTLIAAVKGKNEDHETRIKKNEDNIDILKLGQESQAAISRTWRYALSIAIALAAIFSTIAGAFIASHHG